MASMKLSRSELNIAVTGDIHLGHRRNPTSEIIANLRTAFPDNAETGLLDIIFLCGDVFDDLLSLPDVEVADIDAWIIYMLSLCKKHDIILRILEGTPGHDWKQSERFVTLNKIAGIGADIKYVKDLSIEYIERYGITVLGVPDEWETSTDKTLSQVKDLLRAKGLTHVDYAIMHGQFDYQLPPQAKCPKHDSKAYLELVRELIFINHVHTHSRNDRIIAPGSPDRLSHGEEEPKGHIRARCYGNGEHEVTFVETVNAKRFVTVDCTGLTIDETIERVDLVAGRLPPGSFVRVEADANNPIFTNMEVLIRRYPIFTWSKLPRTEDEEEHSVIEEETLFVPITLTKDNLPGMLMERLLRRKIAGPVLLKADHILKGCL
jgi:hypothetical protein